MWRPEEIQFIIDNYMGMTIKQLSEALNRPFYGVQCKLRKLGLSKQRKLRKLTERLIKQANNNE